MQGMRQPDETYRSLSPSADDAFHRELEGFLLHAEKPTAWQVERVLKQSEYEVTELVRSCAGDGHIDEAAPNSSASDGIVAGADDGGSFASASAPGSVTNGAGGDGLYVRKCIDMAAGTGFAYEELWRARRSGLRLAGVPRIVSCVREDGELRIVMEHVSGVTVTAFVGAAGAGVETARMVMPALCEVVAGLHTRLGAPLIHRDLKPSNVIMSKGRPVVIDFGCARTWRSGAETDTTHFLTRCYAPPEQFGFGQTDVRSDIYALGKMLYFCLTGENPPNVCTAEACLEHGVPAQVAELIATCCALDPQARPADAHALARAMDDALRDDLAGDAVEACGAPVPSAAASAAITPPPIVGNPSEAVERDAAEASCNNAPRDRGIFAHLPLRVGRAWNACVYVVYGFMLVGSVGAIFSPDASDALLPLWFRALEYLSFGIVGMGAACYALLDRRRLYRRFPGLHRLGAVWVLLLCVVLFFGSVLIPSLIGTAIGLL